MLDVQVYVNYPVIFVFDFLYEKIHLVLVFHDQSVDEIDLNSMKYLEELMVLMVDVVVELNEVYLHQLREIIEPMNQLI